MLMKEMLTTVCVASAVAFLTARVTAKMTVGKIDAYIEHLTKVIKEFVEDVFSMTSKLP